MTSFFYNHRHYVRRPKKRKKQYKIITDEKTGKSWQIEVFPKPKPAYIERMRRLFPDFDKWDFEQQIAMMGEDDEE